MGAWAVRFRVAAAACCAAVVALLAAGAIAGLAVETSTSSSLNGGFAQPRGVAAFGRAQVIFSGANLLTAVLLVVATLLVMVAGSDAVDEPTADTTGVLRAVVVLAAVVAVCALVMAGITVWYGLVGRGPLISAQVTQRLGASLSTSVVAAGTLWWATAGKRR